MKKTLLVAVALLAMCQISCDVNGKHSAPVNTGAGTESVTVPEGLTGELEVDAERLAQRSIELSRKMIDGTDKEQETQELQQLIDQAKNYYQSRDLRDDFAIAMNEKMSKGVSDLARQLNNENKQDSIQ